jgi:hypothetical protein
MAEQIISPGVFTRENDLSFLPQGIGQIGAAIVGPTTKGPAFTPTTVNSFSQFEAKFGGLSPYTYVPQTAREYLKNAGAVTIVRVLAGGGYSYDAAGSSMVAILVSGSDAGTFTNQESLIVGVIAPSLNGGTPTLQDSEDISNLENAVDGYSASADFGIKIAGSTVADTAYTASLNPANSNYLFDQLGYSPNVSHNGVDQYTGTPGYTYISFETLQSKLLSTGSLADGYGAGTQYGTSKGYLLGSASRITAATQSLNMAFKDDGIGTEKYNYATTPWITSQFQSAAKTTKDLFRLHTIDHGSEMARQFKVSISNVVEPADIEGEQQYTKFTVTLRKWDDTDNSPNILVTFNDCTLDPQSSNYICKKIGDRYPEYDADQLKVLIKGTYPNTNMYVRVEVPEDIKARSVSPKLSPRGFRAIKDPILKTAWTGRGPGGGAASIPGFPSASYEGLQTTENSLTAPVAYSNLGFLGFKFKDKEPDSNNFLLPLPDSAPNNVSGDFNVGYYRGHASSSLWTGALSASLDPTYQNGPRNSQIKFTLPFQGGNDGLAPWTPKKVGADISSTNVFGFDLENSGKTGYTAYKKALDILSNQDEYDINMLVLPGVIAEHHKSLNTAAINFCETRGDVFYVMDLTDVDSTVNTAVNTVSGLDSNFAAVYYPWVMVYDDALGVDVFVPPSVIVPGAIAASDRIGAEWFAPAGLNRGVLGNVTQAKMTLNQAERDQLYEAKINPIATFPGNNICIWGQKTLQERSTALDRINVRRLLITLKKFIASSSRYLVFEQNTVQTRNRFLNIVNPYLESVQQQQGLYAFRVVMDETNNTPDVIDRNQLVGGIYLQPTRTAEFIVLDFNIMPTGATFGG